jgi:hypothetical protein
MIIHKVKGDSTVPPKGFISYIGWRLGNKFGMKLTANSDNK